LPTLTPTFSFRQARNDYEPALQAILQNNLPQLKGVYLNILPSISKDFPYVIISLDHRKRHRNDETSNPQWEMWEVVYKVIFLSTNLRVVDDVGAKNDFLDDIDQTFANERQQGKFLSSNYVVDLWTDNLAYGDFAFHDALSQETLILTGGEVELHIVVGYTRA
jgi:hypothetical protein